MFGSSATGSSGARPGEAQRAAAERAHHPAQQGEAVLGPLHPRLVHRHHEVDRLDVGHRQPRPRAPEEMRLAGGQAGRGRPDLALGAEDHRREQVVVQVLADAGQVRDDVDAERAQVIRRPDPREQEELRRPDRPAAHDDLPGVRALDAAVLRPLDADAPRAVEQQAPRDRAGDHLEVRVALDRTDVGRRGAVADAVLDAVLHERHAVLRRAVVVRVQRDAALLRRLGDRHVDRVRLERREQAHGARARRARAARCARRPAARPPTTSRRRRDTPTCRSPRARRAPRSSR